MCGSSLEEGLGLAGMLAVLAQRPGSGWRAPSCMVGPRRERVGLRETLCPLARPPKRGPSPGRPALGPRLCPVLPRTGGSRPLGAVEKDTVSLPSRERAASTPAPWPLGEASGAQLGRRPFTEETTVSRSPVALCALRELPMGSRLHLTGGSSSDHLVMLSQDRSCFARSWTPRRFSGCLGRLGPSPIPCWEVQPTGWL